jgi:hypothetical protein
MNISTPVNGDIGEKKRRVEIIPDEIPAEQPHTAPAPAEPEKVPA